MKNTALVLAGLGLVAMTWGCQSGPATTSAPSEPEEGGWQASELEKAPAEVRPLVDVLKRVQDGLYRKKSAATFWDDRLCYVDRVWTEERRRKLADSLPSGGAGIDLQWRGVEFSRSGEFARCEVREVERTTAGRPAKREDVNWSGACLFRKLPAGWRLQGPFLGGMDNGRGPWEKILMTEARFMNARGESSRQAGQPVPDWAADEETIRILGEALALYQESRSFPLLDMMMFLHSNNLTIRWHAHTVISRTFGVDFGYAEDLENSGKTKPAWLKPWQDWARRMYPKGYSAVAWP